jgi:hypothetical protein
VLQCSNASTSACNQLSTLVCITFCVFTLSHTHSSSPEAGGWPASHMSSPQSQPPHLCQLSQLEHSSPSIVLPCCPGACSGSGLGARHSFEPSLDLELPVEPLCTAAAAIKMGCTCFLQHPQDHLVVGIALWCLPSVKVLTARTLRSPWLASHQLVSRR